MELKKNTIDQIHKYSQNHLLEMLNQLTDQQERQNYIKEIESIDYELMATEKKRKNLIKLSLLDNQKKFKIEILFLIFVQSIKQECNQQQEKNVSKNNQFIVLLVAIVILGGGQGSRLGFEYPKGMYKIGLQQEKSLFQLHSERLLRIMQLVNDKLNLQLNDYRELILLTVMCSEMNIQQTQQFFQENQYFGLKESMVKFFVQGQLPAIDIEGKIILESKGKVCMAPNGNGSFYTALKDSGMLQLMKSNGVKHIHVIAVDNALAKIADPFHIGYAITEGAPVTCKAVKKTQAHECVGVHVFKDGKPGIKEYTEIKELAELKDEKDELLFNSAAILNNIFKLEWIEQIVNNKELNAQLTSKYHDAFKKIKYYSPSQGETITPTTPNGYKFELFIFDAFELANTFSILHVPRENEFAPIKNPPGSQSDTPEHAVKMIQKLCSKWIGIQKEGAMWEISPLISYEGEGLEDFKGVVKGEKGIIEKGSQILKQMEEAQKVKQSAN